MKNQYRELANLFDQATKTLEELAEIEDVNIMFEPDQAQIEREARALREFKKQMDEIKKCAADTVIADIFKVAYAIWIPVAGMSFKCSRCGHHSGCRENYCAGCGVKMDKED